MEAVPTRERTIMRFITAEEPRIVQRVTFWQVFFGQGNEAPVLYVWADPLVEHRVLRMDTRYYPDTAREDWLERMRHENRVPDEAVYSSWQEEHEGSTAVVTRMQWAWWETVIEEGP